MNLSELRVVKIRADGKGPIEKNWPDLSVPYGQAQAVSPDHRRWGMVHGEPNYTWVLDVDAKDGEKGLKTLARLVKEHGPLPATPIVHTQNGGRHYIFRWDPDRPVETRSGVLPGVDTRGMRGQSVVPPTPGYRWEGADLEPAFAPDWLMELVATKPVEPVEDTGRPPWLWGDEEGARAEARRFPVAVQGENGHGALFKLAQVLVRGWGLSPELAEQVIEEEWNERCVPPWDDTKDFRRACERAERGYAVPWGARFYHGDGQAVTMRAIKAYGPPGQVDSVVPYRVWPDGSMLQLSYPGGVVQAILLLAREAGRPVPTVGEAKKYADWWKHSTRPVAEQPTPIVVGDAAGPSLARIVLEEGETPAWDEFLARLSCPETFLAWLWMLTLPEATRQILWVRGDGHDGKTRVTQVLYQFLGQAAMAVTDEYLTGAERWFPAAIYGKRLVVLEDTKKRAAARTGPIHRAVGGSPMAMEQKGMPPFPFIPNVALLVTSNVPPEIGGGFADTSRLLPLEVTRGTATADVSWPARLTAELPRLFHRARAAYQNLAVRMGQPQIRLTPAVRERLEEASGVDDEADDIRLQGVGLLVGGPEEIQSSQLALQLGMNVFESTWKDFVVRLARRGVVRRKTKVGNVLTGFSRVQN